MSTIPEKTRDCIKNAMLIGLSKENAYLNAGLTIDEIEALESDYVFQNQLKQYRTVLESKLLERMEAIAIAQVEKGSEKATQWLLEHLFPAYSGKPQSDGGNIYLQFNNKEKLENMDIVEIKEALNGKD